MIEVDGSYGEGGGQILRTALYFSVIKREPIYVRNIRMGRPVSGLRPQHLATLKIMALLTSGELVNARVGSTEVYFSPSGISKEKVEFDVGTAGSITLVLQSVIPAVSILGKRLSITLTGGTDVPWSPTIDYLKSVVKQAFRKIGIDFDIDILRRGYYPRGGGIVKAEIYPSKHIYPLRLTSEPLINKVGIKSVCAKLPEDVARRQADSARKVLIENGIDVGIVKFGQEESLSPGSSVLVYCCNDTCFLGSDYLGKKGVSAEAIGSSVATRFLEIVKTKSCIDQNLSDMIAPVLTFADEQSEFTVPYITKHLETSIYVASLFSRFNYHFEKREINSLVRLSPLQ